VASAIYTIVTPAVLTTPTPNTSTPLTGTSVTFLWNPGSVATHFEFYVGTTGVGSSNIYNSGNVTATSETVSGLPNNGAPLYVRLYWLINGAWQKADYTYVAYGSPTPAVLTTPAPDTSTPLTGTSVAFSWNPGNLATHFEFYVGTTGVGSSNLYNSGNVTVTTETVTGLPSNGETVYARLYSLINGAWQSTDYTYVGYGSPTQAALTTPAPDTSTPLTGTSVAFSWTPGNVATHFEFYVGTTGVGSSNLYNSGNVTVTTETVSGLPSNGETVYARLYSLINGAWQSTDYTYVGYGLPTQAALTTPTPDTSTPLTGTSVAFSWTPGNVATHFEFYAGTTGVGSSNLYNSGNVTATTETVSDLPSNGETVYVRLYSLINGAWKSTDYTYVAYGAPTKAALTTPAPDTTTPLTGTSVAFSWTPGNLATHFEFYVGTTGVGSSNLYNSGNVTVTTETVSDLPNNGKPLYVRLYSLINGAWQSTDYTYVAYGAPTQAALTTPTPDTSTPLTGTSVAFSWTPGNVATHFEFYAGTTGVGSSNLYNSGNVTATTETVSNLPSNGETVYVRLYSLINGAWQYTDYTYVAHGSPTLAALTTPSSPSQFSSTTVTFDWTPGNTATHFELYLGTSVGSSNLYNSGNVTATTETVSGLPSNGETIYARLYSLINGAWQYANYTYTAF
jgi:putative ribosome biogenesis GTPase RsgA